MQQEATNALFHYWNRLRDGRAAPLRSEIEPADIKRLLADTFILEADGRGEAIFRLAGTRLCAIYGRELKGFAFPSLWRARDHKVLFGLVGGVFRQNSVAVMGFDGMSNSGRSIAFEMVLLPLDAGRDNPRCLGLITACERAYWLGADPIVDSQVQSIRVIDPDRDPLFLKNRPSVALGEPVSEKSPMRPFGAGIPRRVRHLVVLDGGRAE
ncbi:MAG: PAS domain-containing protein [Rhizobiaceae bacterium]